MSTAAEWQELTRLLLEKIDVESHYRAWGLKIVSDKPNPQGWMQCHAWGREDTHPSACFNVGTGDARGRYKDAGRPDMSLSFFEATAMIGGMASDWMTAKLELAARYDVKLPSGKEPESPTTKVERTALNLGTIADWCAAKGGFSRQAVEEAGGFLCDHPKGAPRSKQDSCVALPAYGRLGTEVEPVGLVLYKDDGGELRKYHGKGKQDSMHRMLTALGSQPGLLNKWALEHLATAEVVWKVEGPTDMLALHTHIPPELKERVVVISTAFGAGESMCSWWLDLLDHKVVYLVGDRDKAGQDGVDKWLGYLVHRPLMNLGVAILDMFAMEESHGKDLRDFFIGGGTYERLLGKVKPVPLGATVSPSGATLSGRDDKYKEEAAILKRVELHVLGKNADNSVEIYSSYTQQKNRITNIGRITYEELCLYGGKPVGNNVSPEREPLPGILQMKVLTKAIAEVAAPISLADTPPIGQGIWQCGRDIAVVNGNRGAIVKKEGLEVVTVPRIGRDLIDFNAPKKWCDFDALQRNLIDAGDDVFCEDKFDRLERIFSQWQWKHKSDSMLAAALVLCSWIQTLWSWRPMVSISGASSTGKSTIFRDLLVPRHVLILG